jgi:hypothetical protein
MKHRYEVTISHYGCYPVYQVDYSTFDKAFDAAESYIRKNLADDFESANHMENELRLFGITNIICTDNYKIEINQIRTEPTDWSGATQDEYGR